MATRALRLLRRPSYSSLCRFLSTSTSSSTPLSSPVCLPSRVVSQRETLLQPRAYSALSSRHFASIPGGTSGVLEVLNSDEYKSLLNEAKGADDEIVQDLKGSEDKKLAVVYFTAKWCGPCRHISPLVTALSKEFGDVKFLKVDLDEPELQKTIEMAGIAAVPTFQFHLEGKMVSGFSGADPKKLKATVEELLEEAKA